MGTPTGLRRRAARRHGAGMRRGHGRPGPGPAFQSLAQEMLAPGIRWAMAVRDYFMLAGLIFFLSTALARRATAPVTTGEATLVPLRD